MASQSKLPGTSGRPFLQIPGPTLVPERIVRAMSRPLIDHRGPEFAALLKDVLEGLKGVFKTSEGRRCISRLRHRSVGGLHCQYAVTG